MKCLHCDNKLPTTRGFATAKNPNEYGKKKACQMEGCISFGLNFRTKKFREIVMGLTAEQVLADAQRKSRKGVETQRAKGFYDDPSNNPYSEAYWIKRGLTEEEAYARLSDKNKKGSETKRSAGYYDDKANNPYSKEFWIRKGLTVVEAEYQVNARIKNRPEFWTSRGHSQDEAAQFALESADTNSLASKIAKYGDENGHKKYAEFRRLRSESWTMSSSQGLNGKSSKNANRFFIKLYRHFRRLGFMRDDFMLEINRGEFWLRTIEGKFFFYDFVLKPLKIIVEFNGSHVHPSPYMTPEQRSVWQHAYSKETAAEVELRERIKFSLAESHGYTIYQVWDTHSDFDTFIKELKNEHRNPESQYQANSYATV